VEWQIDIGKSKSSKKNFTHYHFVEQNCTYISLGLSCGLSGEKPETRHIGCGMNRGLTPSMWLWCMGKCYRKFHDYAHAWVIVLIFFVQIILLDVCQKYRFFSPLNWVRVWIFPPKMSHCMHSAHFLRSLALSEVQVGERENSHNFVWKISVMVWLFW
jgi:hypothetical protein